MSAPAPASPRERLDPPGNSAGRRQVVQTVLVAVAVLAVAAVAGLSALLNPLAPLGLVLFVVVMAAAWIHPVLVGVLVVAVAPALAGLRYTVGLPGLNVAMVLVVGCALLTFFRRPDVWKRITATETALFVFAAVAAVMAGYHAAVDGSSLASLLRAAAQPALLWLAFWVARRAVSTPEQLRVVLRWTLGLSLVVALLAIAQFADVPGVRDLLRSAAGTGNLPAVGAPAPRITGPFPIWHSLCGYLMVPMTLTVSLLLTGSRTVAARTQLLVVAAAQLAALVMAVTVTSFIWLVVAVLVAAVLLRRSLRALLALVVVATVAVTLFSGVLQERLTQQTTAASGTGGGLLPQTVAYRVLVWQRDFLPLLRQAAGVGIGNDLPTTVFFDHTENQYFTWVLRGGLLLAAAGVAVLVVLLVQAVRAGRFSTDLPEARAALVGVTVFVPAAMAIWPYLTNAGLPLTLFAYAGAVLAVRRQPVGLTRSLFPASSFPDGALVPTTPRSQL